MSGVLIRELPVLNSLIPAPSSSIESIHHRVVHFEVLEGKAEAFRLPAQGD